MTLPTLDRLPLGYFRHPSADVAKYRGVEIRSVVIVCGPAWMPSLVESRPTAVHFAHDLASWHTPPPELPTSAPAPIYESELR